MVRRSILVLRYVESAAFEFRLSPVAAMVVAGGSNEKKLVESGVGRLGQVRVQ